MDDGREHVSRTHRVYPSLWPSLWLSHWLNLWRNLWRSLWLRCRAPMIGFLISIAACTILLVSLGESPYLLVEALRSTCLTSFGLGYTLFYATPLIFTGLAVALGFHCGLFNIGAEGQLYIGSIAIVLFANFFPGVSATLAVPLAILSAGIAGGLWGAIAGWLKAKRNSHEVIVTILLNFIGIALVDYLILYPLKNPQTQNPETVKIASAYHLPLLETICTRYGLEWFATTPVNMALFLAIFTALLVHIFLFHSVYGYELRAVGQNPVASGYAGISTKRTIVWALFLSGAMAGLVGLNEVLGHEHRVLQGFSPQYGFTGIAVALLARNHPLGILLSALLFGALHNSARELEFLSERVSKELSLVLQATLICFVAADTLIEKWLRKIRTTRKGSVHKVSHD